MAPETNKIAAALLVAGIVALLAGAASRALIGTETPAVEIGGEPVSAAAGAELIRDLLPKADIVRGEKISMLCGICHTFSRNEPSRTGPNLSGVSGKKPGSVSGFPYSDGLKNKGGVWNADTLNEFLWNPKKSVPDTKMTYTGLKKPEDRAAVIKWLEARK
ncbi:MAG: c-type cytochrome [Pseudomonadota bacterium]